jgi:putative phage-type endonuclease
MTPVSERRGYIGGSDFYELLTGCELKLWKIKRGGEKGEPTGAMIRGTKLEPLIVEEYEERRGRKVRRENRLLTHKDYPWAAAHIDRWTWPSADVVDGFSGYGRGVLECKSANPFAFRTFLREGLPPHYIAQMQWYLYVTGARWGAYAVLEPVDWQFTGFDVERDNDLIAGLHEKAAGFWAKVENGPEPEKLDAQSKQCRRCQFREECHPYEPVIEDLGEAVRDDSLEDMAIKVAEARRIAKEAKEYESECTDALTEALGQRTNVVAGDLVVIRQTVPRAGYTVKPTNFTTLRVKTLK